MRCKYCHKPHSNSGKPWTKQTLAQHIEAAHPGKVVVVVSEAQDIPKPKVMENPWNSPIPDYSKLDLFVGPK